MSDEISTPLGGDIGSEGASTPKYDDNYVNGLVQTKKEKAFKNGYNKALEEVGNRQSQSSSALDQSAIEGIVNASLQSWSEKQQKLQQAQLQREKEEQDRQLLADYHKKEAESYDTGYRKVMAEASKIDGFDEAVNEVTIFNENPRLISLAGQVENSAEVVYELARNPHKVKRILDAGSSGLVEMRNLASSIKQNTAAKNKTYPSEPLGHIKSSNTGLGDGNLSNAPLGEILDYFNNN